MRSIHFYFLMLSVVFLCSAPMGRAGTIGDPVPKMSAGRWMVTAELDNWDKDMDHDVDLESTRFFAKFTYGVSGNVNIFGRIGLAEFEGDDTDSDYDPAWSVGVKAKIYEENGIEVGLLGQLFRFSGDFSGDDFDVTEIDVACGVHHHFNHELLGYGGMAVSMVELDHGHNDLEEDDPFFFFGGIEFALNNRTDLGVELRVFGESSITFLASFAL